MRLSDIEPQEIDWLWPGRIPRGKLTLLIGDPEGGKSYTTIGLAACVTTGRAWPDGAPCEVGDVLLLQAEDGLADTVRVRLDTLGADTTRVWAVDAERTTISLQADLKRLVERRQSQRRQRAAADFDIKAFGSAWIRL